MAKRIDASGIDPDFVIRQAKPSNREKELKPYDPSSSEPAPETAEAPAPPSEVAPEVEPVKEKEVPREETKRRRGKAQAEPQDFIGLFLHEAAITARSGKTIYICQLHHDRISKILHVIGKKEVSLFSYIYNVLEHHFATFQDEITELYDNNIEKVF